MTSNFEFATPFNRDDVALMEFLAGGATGAAGSGGTSGSSDFPTDPAQAPFPSPENSAQTVLNGVVGGAPYLRDAVGNTLQLQVVSGAVQLFVNDVSQAPAWSGHADAPPATMIVRQGSVFVMLSDGGVQGMARGTWVSTSLPAAFGATGSSGATGSTGAAGTSGTTGASGTSGNTGSSGAAGGTTGATGSGGSSGSTSSLTLAGFVNSGAAGGTVQIVLAYTGIAPGSLTGTWSGSGGAATLSGVTSQGPFVTAYATLPALVGTYTLNSIAGGGAGAGATGNITVTAAVADFGAGVHGPATVMLGQGAYGGNLQSGIASYFVRGNTGAVTWSLSDTVAGSGDSANFMLGPNMRFSQIQPSLNIGIDQSSGAQLIPAGQLGGKTSYAVTVNATDDLGYVRSLVVTVQNPATGPTCTLSANFVCDSAKVANYWGGLTVGFAFAWNGTGGNAMTFSDSLDVLTWEPDGTGTVWISASNLASHIGQTTTVTMTPAGGSPQTVAVCFVHENPPCISWKPNGALYATIPATDGFGAFQIGLMKSSSESGTNTAIWRSNPTGALNTYSFDRFWGTTQYNWQGKTFLLSQVPAGTLNGTCQITSGTGGVANNIVFSMPVAAGNLVSGALSASTVASGLTNFIPSANMVANNPFGTVAPTAVITLAVSGGLAANWSLATVQVLNDNCQFPLSTVFMNQFSGVVTYNPRYTISGSGSSGTVYAWNLSATNETTPQIDQVVITLTDGNGNYAQQTFGVSVAWHSNPTVVTLGPGGTFGSPAAFQDALWATGGAVAYAGAKVKFLRGCPNTWDNHVPQLAGYQQGWLPCPLSWTGDDGTQASFTGSIVSNVLTTQSMPVGTIVINDFVALAQPRVILAQLSQSRGGTGTYQVSPGPDVTSRAMTTQMQQIALVFTPGQTTDQQGKGGLKIAGGYDQIYRRIEVSGITNGSGSTEAGAVYFEDEQPGNLTLEYCYLHDCGMGIMNGDNGRRAVVRFNLIAGCGNSGGNSHNCYFDQLANLVFVGNFTIDSFVHELKMRCMSATIENNVIAEGYRANGIATPVDITAGGAVALYQNVIVKEADDSLGNNGGTVDWCSELDAHPAWPVNNLAAASNVVTIMTTPGHGAPALAYRRFFYANDTIRNLPITEGIPNAWGGISDNQVYNLASGSWAQGVAGAPAPGLPVSNNGNYAQPIHPSAFSAFDNPMRLVNPVVPANPLTFVNPLTGFPPINTPNFAYWNGMGGAIANIAASPGSKYGLTLMVPAGAASGTPLTDETGQTLTFSGYANATSTGEMTAVTWTLVAGSANATITPSGANRVIVATNGALPDGYYSFGLRAAGTAPGGGSQSVVKYFGFIVGAGGCNPTTVTSTTGDALIPSSRFPSYVKFVGDQQNGPMLSGQARASNMPMTAPFFVAGFSLPLNYYSDGGIMVYGNQSGNSNGVLILAFHDSAFAMYQKGSGEQILATAPSPFTVTGGANVSSPLNQWFCFAAVYPADATSFNIWIDGQWGTSNATGPIAWPATDQNPADTLDWSIGSWGNGAGSGAADGDQTNGGVRDLVVVTGTPLNAELESFRNGTSPLTIWGASRVKGWWRMTSDPLDAAGTEPDMSGNGNTLNYRVRGLVPRPPVLESILV